MARCWRWGIYYPQRSSCQNRRGCPAVYRVATSRVTASDDPKTGRRGFHRLWGFLPVRPAATSTDITRCLAGIPARQNIRKPIGPVRVSFFALPFGCLARVTGPGSPSSLLATKFYEARSVPVTEATKTQMCAAGARWDRFCYKPQARKNRAPIGPTGAEREQVPKPTGCHIGQERAEARCGAWEMGRVFRGRSGTWMRSPGSRRCGVGKGDRFSEMERGQARRSRGSRRCGVEKGGQVLRGRAWPCKT
ncbi:MAG: hypothetical protein KatS3mg109_0702 [Pirellulaceae bacterium]|nr:MAG: hypothetical protein KatS3mg109_0702 [Pirellulaceae bacterium]